MLKQIYPSFTEFKKLAKKGNLVPLYLNVVADHVTPVSLINSQWDKSSYCFLLESVEGGEKLGRYSFVSFAPEKIIEETNGLTRIKSKTGRVIKSIKAPGVCVLHDLMKEVRPVKVDGLPLFMGGAVGYCSYETVHALERLPRSNVDVLKWPESVFLISDNLFVFDNTQQLLKLVTCVHIDKKNNLKVIYERAVKTLRQNLNTLKEIKIATGRKRFGKSRIKPFRSNVNRRQFMKSVDKAKKYIAKGDIIQVVLSRRNEKTTDVSPLDIYRTLRVVNPSPYMYLLKTGSRSIIGSSPESLVRLENGIASTRPIAGTRKRGNTPERDHALEKELLSDPKERAEHIMLVDLGRNDLGRVCNRGTVKVPQFMKVERYSHVMHIVSEVKGKILGHKNAFDLLCATFPAGTVSGAPKIRAMEIIDELETQQRGPYAGALGYISYSGNMDMAITIRTILWNKGHVSIQTGAGIVADSKPALEYLETENKAAGMKATIELAERGDLFWENR